MKTGISRLAILLVAIVLGVSAASQEDDIFSFIPQGGRSLLEHLRIEGLPADLQSALQSGGGDAAYWQGVLVTAASNTPQIAALDEWQMQTLAQYLAVRAPLNIGADLPRDGRDMSLALCQSCHIITVVITQDRTREAWLGTMNSPSHIEIETTPEERVLMAEYLMVNAGISIDLVPPALRAGGASY